MKASTPTLCLALVGLAALPAQSQPPQGPMSFFVTSVGLGDGANKARGVPIAWNLDEPA